VRDLVPPIERADRVCRCRSHHAVVFHEAFEDAAHLLRHLGIMLANLARHGNSGIQRVELDHRGEQWEALDVAVELAREQNRGLQHGWGELMLLGRNENGLHDGLPIAFPCSTDIPASNRIWGSVVVTVCRGNCESIAAPADARYRAESVNFSGAR